MFTVDGTAISLPSCIYLASTMAIGRFHVSVSVLCVCLVSAMMPSCYNIVPLLSYHGSFSVYVFWNLKYSEVILGGDE